MTENARRPADISHSVPDNAVGNIRRYLDEHGTGSARATSVVAQRTHGSTDRTHSGSAADNLADREIRQAIRRLRCYRGPNAT